MARIKKLIANPNGARQVKQGRAGSVVNLVEADGTPPNIKDPENPDDPGEPADPVEDEDPETIVVPRGPALQLTKTSDGIDDAVAGQTVTYELVATIPVT